MLKKILCNQWTQTGKIFILKTIETVWRFVVKVVIYTRTSTAQQSTGIQLKALNEMVSNAGYNLVDTIQDEGVSGTKIGNTRKGFKKVMELVNRRMVDAVLVYSVDRIGRKLSDVISIAEQLNDKNVGLIIWKNGIDTTTTHGRHLLNFFAMVAEMERDFISARVADGVALAKSKGKQIGRSKVSKQIEKKVLQLRGENMSINKIATTLSVGNGTIQRILKENRILSV